MLTPPLPANQTKLAHIVSALSCALDLVEGQPEGHAQRSCVIGMRIAQELNLPGDLQSALFYALLLKDLGCSSNASKMCYLFGGDDRAAKQDFKTTHWTSLPQALFFMARNVAPKGPLTDKFRHFFTLAKAGQTGARELVQIRCDRGATIARHLLFPNQTAIAIRHLDEHFDGHGHPAGLKGDAIPLLARILSLAQTTEVFFSKFGINAAFNVARKRAGKWFDPDLVRALHAFQNDALFWYSLSAKDLTPIVTALEPQDHALTATDDLLDRIAEGFSQVIDAKSPWTYCHSTGVAQIATGIGEVLGFTPQNLSELRRAALLHDVGKLGISNTILDKPGKLTDAEFAQIKRHPFFTHRILSRVPAFAHLAHTAADHHEKLNGQGYYRGLSGDQLSQPVRILAVADMYEALAAKRPYRKDLTGEEVLSILARESGKTLCPTVFEALKVFLDLSHFQPVRIAA